MERNRGSRERSAQALDGFISYSHAADGLLAPRLQAGLQRFAKPWWKRRALWIFRDESSLSANPHLWSSITDALDRSAWFILLLSPDAATSEWVGHEIEYWIEHKDPARIIPVITDGTLEWSKGGFRGDALASALEGVFSEEPRWVDLRFARESSHLDLKNPRFSAAVADIASALRDVPKDELESEEVRQHRRTVRTAVSAGVLVSVLAIVAVLAALSASSQERRAEAEALAANALAQLASDPELSILLALHSIDTARGDQPTAVDVLYQAVLDHRTIRRWDVADRPGPFATHAVSADGELLAIWDWASGLVALHSVSDEAVRWEAGGLAEGHLSAGAFSDDGAQLYLLDSGWETESGASIGRIVVVDTTRGEAVGSLDIGECPVEIYPHRGTTVDPSGSIVIEWATVSSTGEECDARAREVGLVDLQDETITRLSKVMSSLNATGRPTLSEDGRLFAAGSPMGVTVIDTDSLEVVTRFDSPEISTLSSDGTTILIGVDPVEHRDTATGELIATFPGVAVDADFSPNDEEVIVSGSDAVVRLYESSTGRLSKELRGATSAPGKVSYAGEGTTVFTESESSIQMWDTSRAVSPLPAFDYLPDRRLVTWPFGALGIGGDNVVVPYSYTGNDVLYRVFDRDGALIRESDQVGAFAISSDGSFIVEEPVRHNVETASGAMGFEAEPLRIVDTRSGDLVVQLEGCGYTLDYPNTSIETLPSCPDGIAVSDISISADDSRVAAIGGFWRGAAWDTASGEMVWQTDSGEVPFVWRHQVGISGDGSQLLWLDLPSGGYVAGEVGSAQTSSTIERLFSSGEILYHPSGEVAFVAESVGEVVVIDVQEWAVRSILTRPGGDDVFDAALSDDGSELAVVGRSGQIAFWDWQSETLTRTLDTGRPLGHAGFLGDELIVIGVDGDVIRLPMDPDDLMEAAAGKLTRSFTAVECSTYGIEPCPTLNQITTLDPS